MKIDWKKKRIGVEIIKIRDEKNKIKAMDAMIRYNTCYQHKAYTVKFFMTNSPENKYVYVALTYFKKLIRFQQTYWSYTYSLT